ncbi:hypothetical protein ACH5RR_034897 [Cinchona calisaya]|uniref:Transposase MuDR plant domain-containing protein n=1 Tax=Cinchona calisaya TaxID=153742 RepID=A0ABD2YC90_9GENT
MDENEDNVLFEANIDKESEWLRTAHNKEILLTNAETSRRADNLSDVDSGEKDQAPNFGSDFESVHGSDEDDFDKKCIMFNPKIINDPQLELGMNFISKKELKFAVKNWNIKSRSKIRFKKIDNKRIRAIYKNEKCNWSIYGAKFNKESCIQIRKFNSKHTCGFVYHNKMVISEILTKDYSTEKKFSFSSQANNGVALASSVVKHGGFHAGDVAAQYKYKNSTLDIKVDTESNIATTLTVTDLLPSTKIIAMCKDFPYYNSGKIEAQYFHEHASFTTAVDLKTPLNIDISATIGTPCIAFGTEASYKVDSCAFTKYNAGFNLTKQNYGVAVILADKGDAVKAYCFYYPDKEKRGVIVGEIAREFSRNHNTLIVGGSYAVDPHTMVKAKLDNRGNLGSVLQHEFAPKSFLTLSGHFYTLAVEKRPRFGLAVSLGF